MRPEASFTNENAAEKELPENVARIEKPEGTFYIVYSRHNRVEDPKNLEDCDAVLLEGIGPYATATLEIDEDGVPQYREILRSLREHKKPFFLVDAQTETAASIASLQAFLGGAEFAVGAKLLSDLLREAIANKKPISRRDFLKKGGTLLLGSYLASPLLGGALTWAREGKTAAPDDAGKVSYFLNDLNEQIHPETEAIIHTFRNNLMAQKMETIAQLLRGSEHDVRPNVGLVVGAQHTGIETAIKKEARERVETIKKILSVPGLQGERDVLATIARFDYIDGKWKASYSKDPSLQTLEAQSK